MELPRHNPVIQSDALEVELKAAVSALGEQTTLNTCPDLASSVSRLRHDLLDLLIVELCDGPDQEGMAACHRTYCRRIAEEQPSRSSGN